MSVPRPGPAIVGRELEASRASVVDHLERRGTMPPPGVERHGESRDPALVALGADLVALCRYSIDALIETSEHETVEVETTPDVRGRHTATIGRGRGAARALPPPSTR